MRVPPALSRLARLPRQHRAPSVRERADALAGLGRPGCPVCTARVTAARQWFTAYEDETHVDPEMRDRVEASLGLCAPHTRQLLDLGPASAWLSRWLFADVARAGRRLLAGERRAVTTCPTCVSVATAEADALGTVVAGLADPAVAELLAEGDGPCLAHGRALLATAAPAAAEAVATALLRRLAGAADVAADTLTGIDPDHTRRARLRAAHRVGVLAAEEALRATTADADVELALSSPCCPVCAAADRTEWRFLGWLVEHGTAAPDLRTEALLCGPHLADLLSWHADDAQVARIGIGADGLLASVGAVVGHVAGHWAHDLQAYLDAAGRARRDARPGRWFGCHVCALRGAAADRARRAVRLVAEAPFLADRLAGAHGLCLRHGLEPAVPAAWRAVLSARVGLLSAELDEAARHGSWEGRFEVKGREMTAWSRAPLLLDGAVLGPLPPAGEAGLVR